MLEVTSLMEGEWSCYRGDQFNGGPVMEASHVTEKANNGRSMVMLRKLSI